MPCLEGGSAMQSACYTTARWAFLVCLIKHGRMQGGACCHPGSANNDVEVWFSSRIE